MVAGGVAGLRQALETLLSPVDAEMLAGGLADLLAESTGVDWLLGRREDPIVARRTRG